jgi:hypothetical protein
MRFWTRREVRRIGNEVPGIRRGVPLPQSNKPSLLLNQESTNLPENDAQLTGANQSFVESKC